MLNRDADVSRHFAAAAAASRLENVGREAAEAAKRSILDLLGVALAASGIDPSADPFVELVKEMRGEPQAALIGVGGRAPAPLAAFCNGVLAHCLDFDDMTPWGQHASSSVVPAVLAVAERAGGASGRDVISAVAVGQDLFGRLRCNVAWKKDWNLASAFGVYAGAVAASRVLRLQASQVEGALAVASQQSAGLAELVAGTGSELRGKYAGFSAQGAVLAALLAQRGVAGMPTLMEGVSGTFATYFGGAYDRDAMLDGLGTEYLGATTQYKKWPAVGTSHSHIHATLTLMSDTGVVADDIRELRLHVGDYHRTMSDPIEGRRAPATIADAKFSLPFIVALAAARGSLGVADFTDESLKDAEVISLARRVTLVDDPDLDWKMELPPGRVTIVTTDGRTLEQTGTDVPGSAERPMTWDELSDKFRDCASLSRKPLSEDRIERTVELVRTLEVAADATELVRLVSP